MSRRFGRGRRREVPTLNTSSLPDLIFTLLFFFMLVTNLREARPRVDYRVPEAARAERLEKKSLVTTICVGRVAEGDAPGAVDGFCIQLNDELATVDDIPAFIASERARLAPEDRGRMVVSLKVDGDAPMGLVADIKEALRRAGALNVSYSAREPEADKASAD
ncbi:MAG TPA: biopolymer transporter ExbD [Candidatus Bacteroides merdipullorum]|uniref:Biopolymer transporter ExbD n=1 Tax=Candidatus Bacteroides merdipullorum TaxID=2838474 RepID=A0A9D2CXU2_9BACE|nr:biopolymer transporter ExbD [Candidatus Bacteroides merdipullorum]